MTPLATNASWYAPKQVGLVLATVVGAQVLREEVTDVGDRSALADGLPVDDGDRTVGVVEEQVVGSEVEVHERVGHRRELLEDLGPPGGVPVDVVAQLGQDRIAERRHEPGQRCLVHGTADLVQRAVDHRDEVGILETGAVPELGVMAGDRDERGEPAPGSPRRPGRRASAC